VPPGSVPLPYSWELRRRVLLRSRAGRRSAQATVSHERR
jgi:hypothetical protein